MHGMYDMISLHCIALRGAGLVYLDIGRSNWA